MGFAKANQTSFKKGNSPWNEGKGIDPRVRFENSFVPDPTSGCWFWIKSTDKDGYGQFHPHQRKRKMAHRYSWEIYNGPIPHGLQVLHKCDVYSCVNPSHLFLGTQKENCQDCVKKNRSARGVRNGRTNFTEDQIRAIRQDTRSCIEIGEMFSVSPAVINGIKNLRSWKHIKSPTYKNTPGRHLHPKLKESDIILIRSDNRPQRIIAEQYHVDQSCISLIKHDKIWKHIPITP